MEVMVQYSRFLKKSRCVQTPRDLGEGRPRFAFPALGNLPFCLGKHVMKAACASVCEVKHVRLVTNTTTRILSTD